MKYNSLRTFLLAALVISSFSQIATAQNNNCADCHSANSVETYHLLDWQLSEHSKSGVGCEDCHGGDASTFESMEAHRGVARSSQPEAPTHFTNLAQTCGKCHTRIATAFEGSRHSDLVRAGNHDAPTCSTCHTSVGAFLLSSKGLKRHCNQCHGEKSKTPRAQRAEFSADLHSRFRALGRTLDGLEELVNGTSNIDQRTQRLRELRNVQGQRSQAAVLAHAFDASGVLEQLDKSEKAAKELAQKIANEPPAKQDP